jgi:uroporphyrinogen-III decarboxylase
LTRNPIFEAGFPLEFIPHLMRGGNDGLRITVGYPVAAIYSNPEKSFRAQVWTREQYGYDSEPFYGYASYGGFEFSGEIKLPDGEYEQAPSHRRFAVEKEQAIEKGKHAPRGYALMQGCEVPVNTPLYNLYIMKKAVNNFGWY